MKYYLQEKCIFEQIFFLQVKIYMKINLYMVGCRQFAGVRDVGSLLGCVVWRRHA